MVCSEGMKVILLKHIEGTNFFGIRFPIKKKCILDKSFLQLIYSNGAIKIVGKARW